MDILKFVVENKDLIAGIFGILGSISGFVGVGVGAKQNFNNVKTNAVINAEKYKKELIKQGNLTVEEVENKALDKAVELFYKRFLTRFIPGILISIFIPKEKAEEMLESWYHQLKQVGLKKIDNSLNKI